MVPNWAKNILFLLVFMIAGLILVIIIEGLISGGDLTPLNLVIEKVVVSMRTPTTTTLMVALAKFGNPFLFSIISLFLVVVLAIKRDYYNAALLLAALVVAVVSLTILKNVFQVTRPASDIYNIEGWSFPSGHATVATTFFFLISYIFWSRFKSVQSKTMLVVGSVVGAGLVSLSRLYLGAHWTLDVLAGMALGLLAVSFTVLIFSLFFGENKSLRNFR